MAQNPKYSYSDDDLLQPVYCIVCRQHIPKNISNAGKGICLDCVEIAKAVAAATATTQVQSNMQTESGTELDYEQTADTNLGEDAMPKNITESTTELFDRYFSTVVIVCIFVIFFGAFYKYVREKGEEEQNRPFEIVHWVCEYCGNTWDRERRLKKPLQYQLSRCNATESGIHSLVDRTSE